MLAPPAPADRLRLLWAWDGGAVPGWMLDCLSWLQAGGTLSARIGAAAPAAGDADLLLLLDPGLAACAAGRRCWLLTDGSGLPLDPAHPLLAGITGGHGIDLALWQQGAPGSNTWRLLRRLHIAASPHYSHGRRGVAESVARVLQQASIDLRLGLPAADQAGTGTALQPAARPAGSSALRRLAQRLRGLWLMDSLQQRSRWLSEHWRIGVIDKPLGDWVLQGGMPPVRWLPAPVARSAGGPGGPGYWADPMADGISDNHLLCEFFDEQNGRGHIERLGLDARGAICERQTLPLGHGRHVSFPLVLQIGGRRIGLAETAALRQCVLHEVGDDGHWRPIATVLDGVAAADPALFEWEGRFWLAYTDIALGALDNLCLQYAEQLEGPWQPHANNPVKVDVTGARMAGGLFWHQGGLYRPAQNCLQTYGASVLVQRVLRCTPTHYEEEAVRELRPDPRGPCPDGMHTLSAWGQRTLVDGKRHVFNVHMVWLKLTRRWRRPRRRLGDVTTAGLR
jgi:hypothetical protein